MEGLIGLWSWIQPKIPELIDSAAYLVLFASVIIKLTPTVKDDNYFKPIIKFIGKYIALDKYGPSGD